MKKKGSIIFYLLIVLLMIRDYVPYVSGRMATQTSVLLLGISYFLFTWNMGIKPYLKYAPMFAIPLIDVVFSLYWADEITFATAVYGLAQLFIYSFICEFIRVCNGEKKVRWLYAFFLGILLFTTVTTYLGNLIMPGASRTMATGLREDQELLVIYRNLNIGGFDFIYFLVLVLPFWYYDLKNNSSGLIKKMSIVLIALFVFLTIYTTEYSTAIIGVLLGTVFLFLPSRLTPQRKFFYVGIAVVCIGVVLSKVLPAILIDFSSLTESYTISIRMDELGSMLEGGSTSGDVNQRLTLWQESLNNFMMSPLYGTGDSGGGHSFFLDTLSKYGMIGLILILIQLKATFKMFVKPYLKTNYATLFLFAFMLNLFLSVVNTIFFYNIFLLCMPLFFSFYAKEPVVKSNRKNETIYHHNRNIP